jgi:signal transduction histidine kinase
MALTAGLIGAVAVYVAEEREEAGLLDQQLRSIAGTLLAFAENDIPADYQTRAFEPIRKDAAAAHDASYQYQIWTSAGRLLLHSSGASDTQPIAPLQVKGYSDTVIDGRPMRAYSMHSADGKLLVQVAGIEIIPENLLNSLGGYLASFFVLSLAAVFALGGRLLRSALQPVTDSARQLRDRGPLNLERLDVANPPGELEPIVAAINQLFERIAHTLSVERNFTALAAHELKTPLAALRLHAQVAAKAPSTGERQAALERAIACVDRTTHLLQQLLVLARVDSLQQHEAVMQRVELEPVYRHVMAELQEAVVQRRIVLRADLRGAAIEAVEFGAYTLLRNLIANAVEHCPPGGAVQVGALHDGQEVQLVVDDSGPGIAPAERSRVFERFYRLPGAGGNGAGLGLSIVQSIARLHDSAVQLTDSPLGGLRASVRFRAASPQGSAARASLHAAPAAG